MTRKNLYVYPDFHFLFIFFNRYGRILIYLLSCLGDGICGIIVAFAPNFTVFLIFRFLQGVFAKGTWMTCYVIGESYYLPLFIFFYFFLFFPWLGTTGMEDKESAMSACNNNFSLEKALALWGADGE